MSDYNNACARKVGCKPSSSTVCKVEINKVYMQNANQL